MRGSLLQTSPGKKVRETLSQPTSQVQWLTTVVSVIQEVIGKRIMVETSPGQKCKTLSK
jgi:hypothetical protein